MTNDQTPLRCLTPECGGDIRAYYDSADTGGPQVKASVNITGVYDHDGEAHSGVALGTDWRIYEVDTDEAGWQELKCGRCRRRYTGDEIATAYPDRYTPDTEDATHD